MSDPGLDTVIAGLEKAIARIDRWALGSVIVVGLGTITGVVTSIKHWLLDKQLQAKRTEQSEVRNKEIAELNKKANEAHDRAAASEALAGHASVEAERARKGAAESIAHAAEAVLETERIRKNLAPRRLGAEEARRLIVDLSRSPGRVVVAHIAGDNDSTTYAMEFVRVFQQANWTVIPIGLVFQEPPILGIVIPQAASHARECLVHPLRDLHIPFAESLGQNRLMVPSNQYDVALIVGLKPSSF